MNTKSNQVLSIESADFHSTLRDAELERRINDLTCRESSIEIKKSNQFTRHGIGY